MRAEKSAALGQLFTDVLCSPDRHGYLRFSSVLCNADTETDRREIVVSSLVVWKRGEDEPAL